MPRPLYIVDAFADGPFTGNPAAVVFLAPGDRPDDDYLRAVANEMNLSETAFVSLPGKGEGEAGGRYGLRWFTPSREVDLCGHATLASAHALYDAGKVSLHEPIEFATRSGVLRASPDADWRGFWLDFPATPPRQAEPPGELLDAVGLAGPLFAGRSAPPDGVDDESGNDYFDWFLVAESADTVRSLAPDFAHIREHLAGDRLARGVIVSAAAGDDGFDVASRCFYPNYGIDEDPVTGSAHCTIGPYFARTLARAELDCRQVGLRGGAVRVHARDARVHLGGRAVTTVRGEVVA